MQIETRSKNAETITTLIPNCFALNSCQQDLEYLIFFKRLNEFVLNVFGYLDFEL